MSLVNIFRIAAFLDLCMGAGHWPYDRALLFMASALIFALLAISFSLGEKS